MRSSPLRKEKAVSSVLLGKVTGEYIGRKSAPSRPRQAQTTPDHVPQPQAVWSVATFAFLYAGLGGEAGHAPSRLRQVQSTATTFQSLKRFWSVATKTED